MYPASFEYYRPKTLAEAAALLGQHREARLLAGGHSLLPVLKLRLASPPALIDIGGLAELKGIQARAGALTIGALTTHAQVVSSGEVAQHCPILAEAAAQIGDLQVRNRGTVGGSLAHADPGADYPTVMLALGATMTASNGRATRDIAADAFFTDLFTTSLQPNELLTAVSVRSYGKGTGGAYVKHKHPASGYAVVGVAALVTVNGGTCEQVSLVVGGATGTPVRATAAEQALRGQPVNDATVGAAVRKVAEAIRDPLGDVYASGDYRVHLATVLAGRALRTAAERARA
ncbi:MAG TPA: xanthine dehydrogenase family protein subunit M [Thermodesulfobacteriota bacterium]